MSKSNNQLLIKTKVWEKENIELIDYLNTDTIINQYQTNTSGVIRRDKQLVTFHPGENLPKTDKDLIQITKNNTTGKYIINCGTWSKNLEKLVDEVGVFMIYKGSIIQDLHNMRGKHTYKLSQGDIIKLGRIYLKVLDIHLKKENKGKDDTKNNNKIKSKYKGTMIHSSSSSCMFINGQQIIKGAFSPKWINNNFKHSQILFNKNDLNFSNSIMTQRQNKKKKDQDSFIIDLFSKKKLTVLPRINSSNELFVLKKFTSKKNKMKTPKDIFLKKQIELPKNKPICRICYGENYNDENPLICPCICKGSMKYIHYLCLKSWLNAKIEEELSEDETEKDNMECITYNKNSICCELCKTKFPDYIIHNNIYYNILFYKPKFQEYIIFESMRVGREKTKYYHVVTFDNRDFINIGRANECELSLTELSVSRFHCMIHKENGQALLEDNTSKFGTLVLVQNKNMVVNEDTPLRLQVNKTYIKFKLELPFSFGFDCCGDQNTVENNKYEYHIQNKKGFDILSFFSIKDDANVWGIDDNDEDDNNNKNITNEKVNEINANVAETRSKNEKEKEKEKELIDKDNENENDDNNNIGLKLNVINDVDIKNNNINNYNNNGNNLIEEEKKEKESLIDKSIVNEKNNDAINDNNNINEDIVEIESENKNELISKENNKEDKKEEIKNNKENKNKNEINIAPKKLNTTRIKKISIKRGKNEPKDLPKLNQVNSENNKINISIPLISDKNKSQGKNNMTMQKNKENNTMKNKNNFDMTNSFINIKNNLNIFNPGLIDNCSEIINHNFTEKKEK